MVGPPKRGNHGNGPPSSIYRRREIGSWLTAPCQKTPTPSGSISPLNVYDEVLCMTLSHNDLVAFPRLLITFLTFFFFTSRPETPNNHVLQFAYGMCHTVGVGLQFAPSGEVPPLGLLWR
jgi:hypothetical protein